jgi:hypothetical protein
MILCALIMDTCSELFSLLSECMFSLNNGTHNTDPVMLWTDRYLLIAQPSGSTVQWLASDCCLNCL